MSGIFKIKLLKRLKSKKFRDSYAAEHLRAGIAHQIRALREDRGWTQKELAHKSKTTQSVISRLEDPNYGKLSLQTLLVLASVFDVALFVRFVSFGTLLKETQRLAPSDLAVPGFSNGSLATDLASVMSTPGQVSANTRRRSSMLPQLLDRRPVRREGPPPILQTIRARSVHWKPPEQRPARQTSLLQAESQH